MTQKLAVIAFLTSSLALAQNVPGSITFNARLTDTGGTPVTGSHALGFGLYDQTSGGAAVWTENVTGASFSTDGVAFVELGAVTPLTASALDGRKLYLEVSVDGTTMSPRLAIVSVPYAIRASVAGTAATVGTLTESAIQKRVTGTCPTGQAVKSIDANGGVQCESVSGGGGGGDITSVTTAGGSGLTGGNSAGDVALSLATCSTGEVLKSNGTSWACATDVGSSYGVTAPIALSGTTLSLSGCPNNQVLKSNGTTWICADDLQGGITGTGANRQVTFWTGASTASGSANLIWDTTNNRLGVGVATPAVALDVAGEVQSEAVLMVGGAAGAGTPTTYKISTRRYIVEAPPAAVGRVIPIDSALTDALCRDKDGCDVTVMMINWDATGAVASRTERLFLGETSRQWRFSNNDVSGNDGATTNAQEWAPWDCIFTDAENYTGAANGRGDTVVGFGLLNVAGGSYSDTTTLCRVVFED